MFLQVMQSIQKIVDDLFDFSTINIDEKKNLHTPIRERIYALLTPASFRLGALDSEVEEVLRTRIDRAVSGEKPITLIIAYGGFKNIHIDSAPHIDWAEVFQLSFVLRTVWEITQIYGPGVRVEYSGDAEAMSVVDNLKVEWIKMYLAEFALMLRTVQPLLPPNLTVTNRDFSEFYTTNKLSKELDTRLAQLDYSADELTTKMSKAINNFCWDGEKELMHLSESEKQQMLEKSILLHKLWLEFDYEKRGEYLEGGTHIPIAHRKGLPGCYGIKSIAGSDIQFWIAKGALRGHNGTYMQTLLSPTKYTELRSQLDHISVQGMFSSISSLETIPLIKEK